ncbi:MAG: helix-turn-helix domain-containing protein [Myxococcales bacterium]|nr:helix-turn-helix domain-containing protein [Myxococcales bacterium]
MTAPAPLENLWDARRVAEYLGASASAVYKWAERGELPCRRIGALLRFVPAEVRAWAEGSEGPSAGVHRLPMSGAAR